LKQTWKKSTEAEKPIRENQSLEEYLRLIGLGWIKQKEDVALFSLKK
jgi:hypothetical protein